MAEITDTMTLGDALDFSIDRAKSLDDNAAADRLKTFKNLYIQDILKAQ